MRYISVILSLFLFPLSVLAIDKAKWEIIYSMWDEKNKTYNLIDLRVPENARKWIVPNMAGEWTCNISTKKLILSMSCNTNDRESFIPITVKTSCNPLGIEPDLILFMIGMPSIMISCDMN